MAHSLGTNQAVRLIDVLPMSIGGRQPDGRFKKIFEANSPLPAEKEIGVTTTQDNQQMIEIFLYQGESEIALDNEFMGAFVISGFPPAPRGKVKLAVKLALTQESILEVSARDIATGAPVDVKVVPRAPVTKEVVPTEAALPEPEVVEELKRPVPQRVFSGLRQFIRRLAS